MNILRSTDLAELYTNIELKFADWIKTTLWLN